jgi:hypothetical protein
MECDQSTSPARVVGFLISHDFLDTTLLSDKAILDVMDSIYKAKDEVTH